MIIVDKALAARAAQGRPIRVGMVGAGFMARGVALQLVGVVPGMQLVAISNRTLAGAQRAYREAGIEAPRVVARLGELEDAIARNEPAVTEDATLLARAEGIDVLLEVTGTVEFAARVVLTALEHRKHVVLMNAELDGTLGPILKHYADRAGVVITNVDGDQPGVTMNLFRFVKGIGAQPVLCGNIKGLQDPYRTPTTQADFAKRWGQNVKMVTSFADGTKISFEQALVANATGMRVAKRGMIGPTVPSGTPLKEVVDKYPLDALLDGPGIVDYVVGAEPNPGVFVLATHAHPAQRHYLNLYKLGEGPLYLFYRPYHLCHFEVQNSIARAALFDDATITPRGGPMVDVIATAKRDLQAGEVLDGLGQYTLYGECENADVVQRDGLLPIGLAGGARMRRDIARDTALRYADVELPADRLCDRLRAEQDAQFSAAVVPAAGVG